VPAAPPAGARGGESPTLGPVPPAPPARRRTTLLVAAAFVVVVALLTLAAVHVARTDAPGSDSAAPPPAPTGPVAVRLVAFNDLHGNLEPPTGSSGRVTTDDGGTVDAGGAAFLAAHVARLRAEAPNTVVLSAGDNVGASPAVSALFHDEPTVDLLDSLGVAASVVGNHEFDEGLPELQRLQRGGCHPTDGCAFRPDFAGAAFPFLGANVGADGGAPLLPASIVVETGGVRIGVIGVTLHDLPTVVSAEAVRGLTFGDEVAAIDRASAELTAQGVDAQVVLMHQGDEARGGPDACPASPDGPASRIARTASPQVDVFLTGQSHQQYVCAEPDPNGVPRPVVQGLSFGRLLSVVDLTVENGDVVRDRTTARNEVVTRDVPPDPAAAALVAEAVQKAAPVAGRPVGSITQDLLRAGGPSGESPLGDVIADAQLAATRGVGAQVALTNPGGIRADLPFAPDGVVTYGEAFTVQPFGNIMQTLTLTGAQLENVLEQQWQPTGPRILQVSATLHYSWSQAAPAGSRVSDLRIDGAPVDPAATYRVSVNNFLAAGGDGFTGFTSGTDVTGGPVDLDALLAYLAAAPRLTPPPADRITVLP
jgi:5'-nucleotidase